MLLPLHILDQNENGIVGKLRFLNGGVDRYLRFENLVGSKVFPELGCNDFRNRCAPIYLDDQQPQETQVLISVFVLSYILDQLNSLDQAPDAGFAAGLHRNNTEIRSKKAVDDEGSMVRRVVDDGHIKIIKGIVPDLIPQN